MRHSLEVLIRRLGRRKNRLKERTQEKRKKRNKRLRLLCLFAVLTALGVGSIIAQAALENEKSGSTRSVHVQDSQIEMSTLVIGSHLIHINGLTSELYEIAMESANEFNQNQMYYKSELAGGAWFEISEATSIADITSSGSLVSKSVIEELEFTHMTGADGITTDLRTGEKVSIFDINNPYDLTAMEELEPLRIQYQILQEKTNKNDSDEAYLEMIRNFFGWDIQNDTTRDCDESLQALENYKNGFSPREKPALWVEKTEAIMTAVDAERRVVSLTNLAGYLDTLENNASGMGTDDNSESNDEEEEQPDFIFNSDIVSAIGDCIQNVEESIISYEAICMTDSGETASAKAEYRYSQELISKARSKDTSGCDKIMEMLCNLQNILDGVIADQDSELDTLTSDLVRVTFENYVTDLRAGISEEYQTAQAQGVSQAILSQYLTEQKTAANADRLEYQTMLDAQFQRMENTAAQSYALRLIEGIPDMEQSVVQDAAEAYLKETIDEHLTWLRKTYAELVKNSADSTDMAKLEKEKEELAKQRQDALDRNDLAAANKLTAEMEAKQNDINKLAESLNAILNSPNSSEADKAKARAGLGDKNTASLLASMADDLTSAIRSEEESDLNDLENQLAALTAAAQLDSSAGAAALQQVQEALDNATGLDADTAASIQKTLTDAKTALNDSNGGELSTDALSELLSSILDTLLGTSFENASSEQQVSAILAVEWYGEEKDSSAALDLAASLATQNAQDRNPYIYDKYKEQTQAYISLQTLAKILGYRYIFDDTHNTVTLQKSKEYYLFTLAKKQYEATGQDSKELKAAPGLMNTLYIHGEDSSKIFDTKAEYIKNALYGVVGTPEVEALAKEIYDDLLEGGT